MQSLDIISVNIWQIVISLLNLALLCLLFKIFLFKPVKKMLAARDAEINGRYAEADEAKEKALELEQSWNGKMEKAQEKADAILQTASEDAQRRSAAVLSETQRKAQQILRQAETDAMLEKKKARAEIKQEIVDVSCALSEKMLGREIKEEDHRNMIDSFLSEIGDGDDGEQ